MATLNFKNVNKIYDGTYHAVTDFNLEIKDKEFIVFVGPSGCGKSTTLRMVAGFEDISSGEIWIDDTCVNRIAPKDRNIAMVFQNYALYPHLTVFDNIAFALKLRKVYMPVMSLDENNPEFKRETKEKTDEYESETNSVIAEMKAQKRSKAEIKEYAFKRRAELISELLKIEDKYETQVMTFDEVLTNDLSKQIDEAKAAGDKELVAQLKAKLDESFNDLCKPAYTYRHYSSREIYEKVTDTAKILGLEPYLKRKPAALSGGQRQRVALGRAIVRNPKVFLMDEPLSNLDAKLRVQTRSEIIKIHKKVGATTIYVTHDQTEAMTMADRIVIMCDGVVQQIGSPKEVYDKPANMFVAGFIGSPSMNFIPGSFDGENFVFENNAGSIKLDKKDIELLNRNNAKEIVLGIRPDHLFLADDKSVNNKSVSFDVTIDLYELLGSEIIVYGQLFGEKILLKISSKNEFRADDVISVVFDEESVHFFDKETGEAIR